LHFGSYPKSSFLKLSLAMCAFAVTNELQMVDCLCRLQSTGTETNKDEGESHGNCKRTYKTRTDERT
jgi:hypothetical protein